jgi:hypothetical protein
VHLVDFGIASLGQPDDLALTDTRMVIGTLRYTAPERLAGAKASPRSDVWALGAVLYEMLTGQPLAPATDAATMLSRPTPNMSALDTVPPELAAILRRATAPDPLVRYADAGAFRDALDAGDGNVGSGAETVVVPLGQPVEGPVPRRAVARMPLSPVDRAASVFFGAVAVVTLLVTAALVLNPAGQAATPPTTPAPTVVATPVAEDAVASQPPAKVDHGDDDDDDGGGRGRGNGKGKGNKD